LSRQKVKTGQIRKLRPLALRPGRGFLPTFFPAQARRIYFKIRITPTTTQNGGEKSDEYCQQKAAILEECIISLDRQKQPPYTSNHGKQSSFKREFQNLL
jgi:hypothetical protein